MTQGKKTIVTESQVWGDKSTYTTFFDTNDYVPQWGFIKLNLPKEISFLEDPSATVEIFSVDAAGVETPGVFVFEDWDSSSFKMKADAKIEPGSFKLIFSNTRNPRILADTDVFVMETFDSNMILIAKGSLDNVRMAETAKFENLTIARSESSNGMTSDYQVGFTSEIPVENGDIFYL